jgi:hypothetical protein
MKLQERSWNFEEGFTRDYGCVQFVTPEWRDPTTEFKGKQSREAY